MRKGVSKFKNDEEKRAARKAISLRWYHKNKVVRREAYAASSRKYRLNNPEKTKASAKKYLDKNAKRLNEQTKRWRNTPGGKSKILAYRKMYAEKNRESILEKKRQWAKKQRETLKKLNLKKPRHAPSPKEKESRRLRGIRWRKTESGRLNLRAACLKRRALLRNADGTLSTEDVKNLRSEKFCFWCKEPFLGKTPHIDHVVPLSKGGRNSIENCVASCHGCNSSKHAKSILDWMKCLSIILGAKLLSSSTVPNIDQFRIGSQSQRTSEPLLGIS